MLFRSDDLKRHPGEISFPGGRQDPGETLVETALREAHEEIGLEPGLVTLLGPIDRLVTPSGFSISPFVGVVDPAFVPVPNPAEVDLVFRAPLVTFTTEPRGEYPRIGYDIESQFVWGATFHMARTLALLLQSEGLL